MNVTCTSCQTVFRVDPAKVPAAGVRARCSECAGVFWVRRPAGVDGGLDVATAVETRPATQVPLRDVPIREVPVREVREPAPREAPIAVRPTPPPAPPREPPPAILIPEPRRGHGGPSLPPPAVAPAAAHPVAQPPAIRPPAQRSGPAVAPRSGMVPPATPVTPPPAGSQPLPQAVQPPAAMRPAPPAAVPSPPAFTGAAPVTAKKRRVNPFMSQDPEAKARRLARALISDMVVYHPAKRREGLQNGSLKVLFEEEIKKSWEEYVDQVGKDLAEATPFFHEALTEILADGRIAFP